MADGLNIKINTKRLEKALKTSPEELNRVMPGVAFDIGKRFRGTFRAKRLRGPPGVRGTRQGLLKDSAFNIDVSGSNFSQLRLKVSSRSPIAFLHEKGGITPGKKGGSLAVPFSSLSKAERKSARQLLRQSSRVLQARSAGFDLVTNKGSKLKSLELFVTKGKGGTALLVQRVGKRLRVLFHLQRRVRNRPLLGFFDTWNENRPQAIKLFNRGIGFALAAARKKAGAASG